MKRSIAIFAVCVLMLLLHSCTKENTSPTKSYERVNLSVMVKLRVGAFLYENIEAPIRVKGFDANNNIMWSDSISFAGPKENLLSILSGFDHYTISLEKWGVTDSQTITGKQLQNDRADGPTPVTYVLAGKAPYIRKPVIIYEYTEDQTTSLKTQSRIEYKYNSEGKIERMTVYENYSTDSSAQVPTRYTVFSYDGSTAAISRLTEYYAPANFKSKEDSYEYGVEGSLIKITEANYAANLTATMALSFNATNGNAKAAYQFSNGIGFDYDFVDSLKNIVSDQTIKESSLCNKGIYAYDRNINPFKHLGYVSFELNNYSANNRVTEKVDYMACGFPVLNPESYEYQYDDLGYPTKMVTHYKGTTAVTATKYYYQSFPQ